MVEQHSKDEFRKTDKVVLLMALNKRGTLVAITKVWIEEGCISCGNSEENCPEVFKLKDGMATVLENVNYSGLEEKIIDAAEFCPVEVIKYEEA